MNGVLMAVGLCLLGEPTQPPTWDEAAARHLLSRACFGGTPEQARRLAGLPLSVAVDQLLDGAEKAVGPGQPDWVRPVWVNGLRRYQDMDREEYLVLFRRASSRNDEELLDLKARWVGHMIRTPDPLRENLTLFWHGHFTSASSKMFGVSQAFYHQNETWRKHALGNFRAFLEAVTLDPGMLIYLDLEESNRSNPNENYARELLELFALGVGHYREEDIREIARALTGWTLDAPPGTVKPNRPTNPETARSLVRDGLVPRFLPDRHDEGIKSFLGQSGRFGIKEVMDLVCAQAACSEHIASKLIQHFGVSDPNGSLRERMAKRFRETGGQLRPMVRELFLSPEFYHPNSRANRVKSPVRLLVGACRDLDLQGPITAELAQATVPLGQELFNPPSVKGWPQGNDWITATTLTLRYRLGEVLLDGVPLSDTEPLGRLRGTLIPREKALGEQTIARLLAIDREKSQARSKSGLPIRFEPQRILPPGQENDPAGLVNHLLERMLIVKPREITRNAILEACAAVPPAERPKLAARLILACPEYQLE